MIVFQPFFFSIGSPFYISVYRIALYFLRATKYPFIWIYIMWLTILLWIEIYTVSKLLLL